MRRGARLLLVLSLSAGCAASQTPSASLSTERLARARELKVAERVPDLWAAAERARKEAGEAEPGSPARADSESEARFWLEAAIVEGSRLVLSDQRLSEERELAAAEAELSSVERERADLAQKAERMAAAALARSEAERALERAKKPPHGRPKLSRAELTQAAEALLARATLVQAALSTLGADSTRLSAIEALLGQARKSLPKDPDAALDQADRALARALSLLGELKTQAGSGTPQESAALVEALRESGLHSERNDRGLSALLPRAFSEARLSDKARTGLAELCTLAQAHGRGHVQATVFAQNPTLSAARAELTHQELAQAGCAGERFAVLVGGPRPLSRSPLSSDAERFASDDLELTFLAY